MKKLSLKLEELSVDSFQPAADEKLPDGTVQGYATLPEGGLTCYETCGLSCRETCRRCPV